MLSGTSLVNLVFASTSLDVGRDASTANSLDAFAVSSSDASAVVSLEASVGAGPPPSVDKLAVPSSGVREVWVVDVRVVDAGAVDVPMVPVVGAVVVELTEVVV